MGGIFLRRALKPTVEVINDASGDLVNFYRIIQRHPNALFDDLRWRPAGRADFDRLKRTSALDLTDIERAGQFLYLQTLAFAGKIKGRNFGVSPVSGGNFNLARLRPRLEALHDRLTEVIIEHLDWSEFIPRYDRPTTLFYLDPPYWGREQDYGANLFSQKHFTDLAGQLRTLQGRFILSINDVPQIRTYLPGPILPRSRPAIASARPTATPPSKN